MRGFAFCVCVGVVCYVFVPVYPQPAEKKPRLQDQVKDELEKNVVKPIQLEQLSELPSELLSKHQEYIMKQVSL